ncbi:MAG: DUF4178 domain-containing protein [bacterium]|nr:DUF4178 domain-containing protein [bacterium]
MNASDFGPNLFGEEPPAVKKAAIRKFNCPSCGGEIQIRAVGHTLTAVCAHCGTVIDTSDERFSVIEDVRTKLRPTLIEIGQRGTFDGIEWETIGYVLKSDRTGQYFWDEYLLFNPYHGFRFLVQMDGHWSFVRVVKEDFQRMSFVTTVWYQEHSFQAFLRDQPVVQYVKGEFYWRIKKGDTATTEDYVCPPYMLSFEKVQGEETASLCEYTLPDVVQAAFTLQSMPRRKGVGPNQPSAFDFKSIMRVGAIAAAVALVIHIGSASMSASQTIVSINATHVAGDQTRTFTTDPFTIPSTSNVYVKTGAQVSNSWAELNLSFVNEATKEIFELSQGMEFYFGSDSDGPWREGDPNADGYLSSVPPGTYRLTYDVESDTLQKGLTQPISIAAARDVTPPGNFFWTLFLLLFYPGIAWLRSSSFENRRWENSDFPRSGGDEGDE